MRREIVRSVSGGRILTGSGLRVVAGNTDFGVGSQVFIFDGVALGQRRTQGRPRVFELPAAQPAPVLPLFYHFADASALKMYYVDADFAEVVRVDDITPPAIGAVLALHCYNEATEYLVWFVDSRCIIEQNGETVADFTSVFAEAPEKCDAYIDGYGNLIWAGAQDVTEVTMAVYENGTVTKNATYSDATIEEEYLERILERAVAVTFTATATPYDQVTDIYETFSTIPRNMVVYRANYQECVISTAGWGISGDATVYGGHVFDLFNADVIIPVYSWATPFITAKIVAEGVSQLDPLTISDQTYEAGGINPIIDNTTLARKNNGVIIAEMQTGEDGTLEMTLSNQRYSTLATEQYEAEPEIFYGTAFAVTNYPVADSGFWLSIPSISSGWSITDVAVQYPFVVIGDSGENSGVTREALMRFANIGSVAEVYLLFSSPWPHTPVAGDVFHFSMYRGAITIENTECDLHIAASYPEIDYDSGISVETSLGNGYSIAQRPKIETVLGWVSTTGQLNYGGTKIYSAHMYSALSGAWKTAPQEAVGVANGEIIIASEATVQTIDSPFSPKSIVTKRFAGVNL